MEMQTIFTLIEISDLQIANRGKEVYNVLLATPLLQNYFIVSTKGYGVQNV
jgi:hypothetical protein